MCLNTHGLACHKWMLSFSVSVSLAPPPLCPWNRNIFIEHPQRKPHTNKNVSAFLFNSCNSGKEKAKNQNLINHYNPHSSNMAFHSFAYLLIRVKNTSAWNTWKNVTNDCAIVHIRSKLSGVQRALLSSIRENEF